MSMTEEQIKQNAEEYANNKQLQDELTELHNKKGKKV